MSVEAKGSGVMDDVRKCQFVSGSGGMTDWMSRDALCGEVWGECEDS